MNEQTIKKGSASAPNVQAIDLDQLKRDGKVFKENTGASILDIGDRIGLIEFHTKANSINDEVCAMIVAACKEGPDHFDALVIGNRGKHFSAGADLAWLLGAAREKKWADIEGTISGLQSANMLLKYGPLPAVAAPFNAALGGGCEVCLHSTHVIAAEKTYMGLVEAGVGLVPSGGGTKELTLRAFDRADKLGVDPLVEIRKAFELIVTAKRSSSGEEAKKLFLTENDNVVAGDASPIEPAKQAAAGLPRNPQKAPRKDIPVLGKAAIDDFKAEINRLQEAKTISEHDGVIALHVATIMCAGDHGFGTAHEEYFLELERQAFLSLLGTQKTQERIEFLLKNNKPLRN